MDTIKCNQAIEMFLNTAAKNCGDYFKSDVVFLKAPMMQPIDDAVKDEIEELKQHEDTKDKLTCFIETNGGYVETVERIVKVFRQHYKTVEYIVPNYAYSAGTILALSGDELYMNYYSVLGPIDPQIGIESGSQSVPGMGYLAKFEELMKEINDPGKSAEETRAQTAFLIKKFDPAVLFIIEQAIEHSRSLLREWLPKYKFKHWKKKETTGATVTAEDRRKRAADIAQVLGDATRWHSHGRGVSIAELESEEIKLKVKNCGDDPDLYGNISHYYGLLMDYMAKNRYGGAIHTKRGVRRLA